MKYLLSPHLFPSSMGLILVGVTLMLALRLSYRRAQPPDLVFFFVRIVAAVLMLIGWLALMIAVAQPVAIVASTLEFWMSWWMRGPNYTGIVLSQIICGVLAWLVSLVLLWIVVQQMRLTRKRTNATLLAIAVKNQIPIPDCIASFAMEQGGRFEYKSVAFADDLRTGMPLETAIPRHHGILPPFIELTTRIGQACDNLAAALRYDLASDLQYEPVRRAIGTRMLYFAVVLVSLATMMTFVGSHLSTAFTRILDDYTIGLHPTSQAIFSLTNNFGIALLWCLVVIMAMGLLYASAWCIGFAIPVPPGMGWLAIQSARSTIERALAFPAEQQRPLGTMMGILAKYYPIRSIRSKLRVARDEINDGSDWIGSLRSASLLGRADTAVMYAAQRAGNLSWALREMAESNERRFIYRLQALMQVGTVIMVVALGSLVFFTCLAIFLPIVDMIESQI